MVMMIEILTVTETKTAGSQEAVIAGTIVGIAVEMVVTEITAAVITTNTTIEANEGETTIMVNLVLHHGNDLLHHPHLLP